MENIVLNYLSYVLLLPNTICNKSKYRSIRILGIFLMIPFIITWLITGIPMILLIIIDLFNELIKYTK